MNTRTIYYIDENEDYLENEVALALTRTMDENLEKYCEAIAANYILMGIDVNNYPVQKIIYYLDNE